MENDTIYKTNQPTDQQINMTYISQVYMHTCMMHSRDHRGSIANCPIDQQVNMTNNRPPCIEKSIFFSSHLLYLSASYIFFEYFFYMMCRQKSPSPKE